MEEYMLPCLNKRYLGFDCPGCGMQRALMHILNGEFAQAWNLFPAIYTMLLLLILIGAHLTDKARSYHKIIIVTAIVNGLIMIISYIYKITN